MNWKIGDYVTISKEAIRNKEIEHLYLGKPCRIIEIFEHLLLIQRHSQQRSGGAFWVPSNSRHISPALDTTKFFFEEY